MDRLNFFYIILTMSKELIPNPDQLKAGIDAFYLNEHRAQTYFKAISNLNREWGNPDGMAFGINLLLKS